MTSPGSRVVLWVGGMALALVLASCAPSVTPEAARPTAMPAATAPESPTATPVATRPPTPEVIDPSLAGMTLAQVVEVVDGDTIKVLIDGQLETVRYIGIDAPEGTEAGTPGGAATVANADLVAGRWVLLEKDVSDRDSFGRLLRYVYLPDGRLVNAELVRQAMARANAYPPDTARQAELIAAEETAVAARAELISITDIRLAGTGDAQPDEYIEIANPGATVLDLSGWRIQAGHEDQFFTFPEGFALQPGQTCRMYTNQVLADSCGGFTFGYDTPILNNKGDCAELYDAMGVLVVERCVEK